MSKTITIKGRAIGEGKPVFIIAEAGVNHNGSVKLAKKLIDAAKRAGADAIKFQTFTAAGLVTPGAAKADYQKVSDPARDQYTMLKKLELTAAEFAELFAYGNMKKIIFISTPFDAPSALLLQKLGVPCFKISSGDLTDHPLLAQVARYGRPVILSTGMADLDEVKAAVGVIRRAGNKKLVLLHCTSNYPADYADLNLRAIWTLRDELAVPVGYSDHSEGSEASVAAVALGACVIEKHFTLDRNMAGPDHRASLAPAQFAALVKAVRQVEQALGDGKKVVRRSELNVRAVARKSVVALVDLPKGARLSPAKLAVKRPGNGIEPKYFARLIGRRLKRALKKDAVLTWSALS